MHESSTLAEKEVKKKTVEEVVKFILNIIEEQALLLPGLKLSCFHEGAAS